MVVVYVSVCVCVCKRERDRQTEGKRERVLSGQQRCLGQCHAPYSSLSWACTCPPLVGLILGVPCPSTAPLAGVLTLQQCCDTLVFHQALPSTFFLLSAQPQGFPDETEVRGAPLSSCKIQSSAMPLKENYSQTYYRICNTKALHSCKLTLNFYHLKYTIYTLLIKKKSKVRH